jgi:hypothetical protein
MTNTEITTQGNEVAINASPMFTKETLGQIVTHLNSLEENSFQALEFLFKGKMAAVKGLFEEVTIDANSLETIIEEAALKLSSKSVEEQTSQALQMPKDVAKLLPSSSKTDVATLDRTK